MSLDTPTPLPLHGLDPDRVSRDVVARPVGGHEAQAPEVLPREVLPQHGLDTEAPPVAYIQRSSELLPIYKSLSLPDEWDRPGDLEHHPLAALFPLLEGNAYEAFRDDIAQHGLREPIVVHEGKVLDGRNRLRACVETGTELVFRGYAGPDPLAFVISANLQRRHLDESQRAMVAARLATLPRGANQHAQICAPSQDDAAERLNVSRRSTQFARKVLTSATPELVAAVDQGQVAVSAAAQLADADPDYQRAILEKVAAGSPIAALVVHKPHVTHNSGEREWYTPAPYIARVRAVLGEIDLDPCSCEAANKVVGAKRYYTAADDGLRQEWSGNIYMNPSYAERLVKQFIKKLLESRYAQAIVLTNNNTETDAAQALMQAATAICFPDGRVQYWGPRAKDNSPVQGQMLCYLGPYPEVFAKHFRKIGRVWQDRTITISLAAHGGMRAR